MITSQIIRTSIEELKTITRIDIGVYDTESKIVVSTFESTDLASSLIAGFLNSPADSQVIGEHHLLKVMDDDEVLYILDAIGSGDDAYMIGRIAVSQLQNLIIAYKEKFDRNNFFQNLLMDNMLLVDVYNRARKLHIEATGHRVVYLIEVEDEQNTTAQEYLSGLFSHQSGDYITAIDEQNLILIKSISENDGEEELRQIAETIVDMLNAEAMINVRVSYGNIVTELKDVSKSYKEASMALEVGKIFYDEKKVTSYGTLGIGRLIYQLPDNLCKIFVDEIFGDKIPLDLDEETLTTINKFFENNLNVSETSRQLFVHRNTLVYRIEKLQKSTGLDIRIFDEALTFKIALMVMDYMKYLNSLEY